MIVVMVRIPVGSDEEGERIARSFRERIGSVHGTPGFLGFELLKGEHEYISLTRWASREDLRNWTAGEQHAAAHSRPQAPTSAGHPHGEGKAPSAGAPASSTLVYEVVIPSGEQ
jgi:heme-degrading monooxygenase HmoA